MQTIPAQTKSHPAAETDLQNAFRLFSQMSGQLETSYRQLEQRVEQLSTELAAANSEKLIQLAEKEKLADQLAALHEAMPAAVIWVDKSQNILSANHTAAAIFKENIVGKNWKSILNKPGIQFNGHELQTDSTHSYSYNQCALGDDQGQVIILTDVTLSRQLQQSSHRQQRLAELGEITAGLAHQVRTPLASALLSVDHLSHPTVDEALRKKSVKRIKENLQHLDHLVNDMLLFVRDGEFESDQVEIAALFEAMQNYFDDKNYADFSLSVLDMTKIKAIAPVVSGSKDALLSVLISLAENTTQLATAAAPIRLIITCEFSQHKLIINVTDNGPGLTQEQCELIFKPFYTTKKEGTGLGLAISRSIIRAHNGSLNVFSEPGKGTTMQIELQLYKTGQLLTSNTNINALNKEKSQ